MFEQAQTHYQAVLIAVTVGALLTIPHWLGLIKLHKLAFDQEIKKQIEKEWVR